MKPNFTSTTLLVAVAALGQGIVPAFAANGSAAGGYVFPGFGRSPAAAGA